MAEERLQKVIARYGACSRRHAERWILAGRVAVNGHTVAVVGTKIDPLRDVVDVDGRRLRPLPRDYWAAHKPASVARFAGAPSGMDAGGDAHRDRPGLFPIGRMDASAAGLLLLTNDGPLAGALTQPGTVIDEDYLACVAGHPDTADLRRLRRGLDLDGRRVRLSGVEALGGTNDGCGTALLLTVVDRGARARLRWLFDAIGHPVLRMSRRRIGPVSLGDLPEGSSRRLTLEERAALRALAESR